VAEFVYEREGDQYVMVVLRVPKRLWDRYEYRHGHFGKAIYNLRETMTEWMAGHVSTRHYDDTPDPFFRD
jgi:hypothetical protein